MTINLKKMSFEELQKKVASLKENRGVDLSTDEDLSIAVMNLISLEEHFFFSGAKTKKDEYYDMLKEVREMRKVLLARMIDKTEGRSEERRVGKECRSRWSPYD